MKQYRRTLSLSWTIGMILLGTPVSGLAASGPANDNFTDATEVSGSEFSVMLVGTTIQATHEAGEPFVTTGSGSVWYRWKSPFSGVVQAGFVLGAGSVRLLSGTSFSDFVSSSDDLVAADALVTEGTTYYFNVHTFGTNGIPFRVSVMRKNDMFVEALPLAGWNSTNVALFRSATSEPGETFYDPLYTRSVWFKWTAPASGSLSGATSPSSSLRFDVFVGSSLPNLLRVKFNPSFGVPATYSFRICAGETFYFRFAASVGGPAQTAFTFSVSPLGGACAIPVVLPNAANDDFQDAIEIGGASNFLTSASWEGSKEPNEPATPCFSPSRTLWWKYLVRNDGVLLSNGGRVIPSHAVYKGTSIQNLVPAGSDCSGNFLVSTPVLRGETVYFQVQSPVITDGAYSGDYGGVQVVLQETLANDNFADSIRLHGTSLIVLSHTAGARLEPGEQLPNSQGLGRTVWYSWVAPLEGTTRVGTLAGIGYSVAYQGTSLQSLERLGNSFVHESGQTYFLQLDSGTSDPSNAVLTLTTTPAELLTNDNFDPPRWLRNVFSIYLDSVFVSHATLEAGEPPHRSDDSKSVWWAWRAPSSGVAQFDAFGAMRSNTTVAVYLGEKLNSLHLVKKGALPLFATVRAGDVYRIAVAVPSTAVGHLSIHVESSALRNYESLHPSNIVQNASFEEGGPSGLEPWGAALPNIEYVKKPLTTDNTPPAHGDAFQILPPGGSILQTVATIPGKSYTLKFAFSIADQVGWVEIRPTWDGTDLGSAGAFEDFPLNWHWTNYTVLATKENTIISLQSHDVRTAVDAVTLVPLDAPPQPPPGLPPSPPQTFVWDDGSAESFRGKRGGDLLALNHFNASSPVLIDAIQVLWNPISSTVSPAVALYSDPNGDGNPSDMIPLVIYPVPIPPEIVILNDASFQTTVIPPTTVAGSFFVGAFLSDRESTFDPTIGLDLSYSGTNQSWVIESSTAGGLSLTNPITTSTLSVPLASFGAASHMIRAHYSPITSGLVVASITRQNPIQEVTPFHDLVFRVTFSRDVSGVDSGDFTLSLGGTLAGAIESVSPSGGTNVFDVTVAASGSEGSVRLDLKGAGTGISDGSGNAISGGFTTGESYMIMPAFEFPAEQIQQLIAFDGSAGDGFGNAVAVDRDTIVVGVTNEVVGGNIRQGAAYVYVREATNWVFRQKLTANDGAAFANFGNAVAIDRETIVVGAYTANVGTHSTGAAYVFARQGAYWIQRQKLVADDGAMGDSFGCSVAVDGDVIIVGAYWDSTGANTFQGSAYVFSRVGTNWTQQQKLTASDGAAYDQFGISVALDSGAIVVGASQDFIGIGHQGSAYVFTRGTDWTQEQKLIAADSGNWAWFGSSVAVSGDTIVVGASESGVGDNSSQGSAYIFARAGTTWSQQQNLIASDGVAGDRFGASVDIEGDLVLVSTAIPYLPNPRSSTYLFYRTGTSWAQRQTFGGIDRGSGYNLGRSAALSGNTIVVGASGRNVPVNFAQGAVFVFGPDPVIPLAPIISGIRDDTGVSTSDGVTSDTTPAFFGKARAGDRVTLRHSVRGVVGDAIANAAGAWSVSPFADANSLAAGLHTFTAVDPAGVVGPPFTILVDPNPPAISITPPLSPITRSEPVVFTVYYDNTNLVARALKPTDVILNATGTARANILISSIPGDTGRSFVVLTNISGDGALGISIVAGAASDRAGNKAPAGGPSPKVVVDNTAPVISILSLAGDDVLTSPESAASLVIEGTAGGAEGQFVTVRLNNKTYEGRVFANSWTATIPSADLLALSDGARYAVTADVFDSALNPAVPATRFLTIARTRPVISAEKRAGVLGAQILIPVVAWGFSNIASVQCSMHWDPTVVSFVNVEQFGLPALTTDNFGVGAANTGTLRLSWDDSSAAGVTLADAASLFSIRFAVVGAYGSVSAVTIDGNPIEVEVTKASGETVPVAVLAGEARVRLARISGTVRYYLDPALIMPGIALDLAGGMTSRAQTGSNGSYEFELPPGNCLVTPQTPIENPPSRGVSTVDISLIRRHILSIANLDSPYKLLAADVNGSRSVSTADIAFIRRLILDTTNSLPAGLWRFVRASSPLLNLDSPWGAEPFREYANQNADLANQDFIAIKLGDVNGSWTPAPAGSQSGAASIHALADAETPLPRIVFKASSFPPNPDGIAAVEVSVASFVDVTTAQFTLEWDPASWTLLTTGGYGLPGLSAENFGLARVSQSWMTFSWDSATGGGVTLPDGTAMFTAYFRRGGANPAPLRVVLGDAPTVREVSVNLRPARFVSQSAAVPSGFGPRITPASFKLTASTFEFAVTGTPGETYVLQSSTDLVQWSDVALIENPNGVTPVTLPRTSEQAHFYRLLAN